MTPHEKIIEAATHDAKNAVDQLIDAIGRIMLATLEQHQAQAASPPPNSPWTPQEDDLLRQHYPRGGSKAVQDAGVRRSRQSVRQRAQDLNIRFDGPYTPQQDALIRQHYPNGGVKATREAGLTGLTATQINKRAHTLGVKRIKAIPRPAPEPNPTLNALERVLADLLRADQDDMPLDEKDLTRHDRKCLTELADLNLAKNVGKDLWAPTLAAIAQHNERRAA